MNRLTLRLLLLLVGALAVLIPASIGRGAGSPGLVAAYGFEEGSGTSVADASLTGNTGTITGATRTVGRFGQGLSFNGLSDWVTIASSPSLKLTTAMTLEAWVLPSKLGSVWRTAIIKQNVSGGSLDYALYAAGKTLNVPSGHVFTNTETEAPATTPIALNKWTHIAATYDGSNVNVYVNGVLAGTAPASGPITSSDGVLRLGGNSVWGEYLSGKMDEVRIYNRALSSTEIQTDMNTPVVTDTTKPTVATTDPANGAVDVGVLSSVNATFSEAMAPGTMTSGNVQLSGPSGAVSASVTYDDTTGTATLKPAAALAYGATYTATVTTGATDLAGNHLASTFTSTFTTEPAPPPILVVTTTGNGYSQYYPEILRAEGLNDFSVADLSALSSSFLSNFQVVVLGETALTAAQVTMLTGWVNAGGNLIAMRPDKQLAGLLGVTDAGSTLSNGYLLANTASGAGQGIVNQTIQFHGTADRYGLIGATGVATLYSDATTATTSPAVTLRTVGAAGGEAAAFTYDLAKSVILTRQGNPAWVGQDRDGSGQARTNDLFYGNKAGDVQPDWVDLNKVAIPQADEQQRLLANLIERMAADKGPIPRFWYLPNGYKAAVVMTGDDHAFGGTAGRFDQYTAISPHGCSVVDWQCVRATSYVFPFSPITDAQAAAYNAAGFEVSIHVNTDCLVPSPDGLDAAFNTQLHDFALKYTSIPAPSTQRTHCIIWPDWASQPKIELSYGIRLDTNYYYYGGPTTWAANNPGFMTGSGFPMRFGDSDGTPIDVYQATTQLTDESFQPYPATIDALLDGALGPNGFYGVFTANSHTDHPQSPSSDAIVSSAISRGVPIVSAKQMLTWLDGRNGSSFSRFGWTGNTLGFTIRTAAGSNNLQAMLPLNSGKGTVSTLTRDGSFVPFTTQTIKGISYAFFSAQPGTYAATLDPANAPRVTATKPVVDGLKIGTDTTVTATFSKHMATGTITPNSFTLRNPDGSVVPASVTYDDSSQIATLRPTAPLITPRTYRAEVSPAITDSGGTALLTAVDWSFTTGAPHVVSTTPVDGTAAAPRGAAITATFSAGIDPTTLSNGGFVLKDASGTPVTTQMTYDAASNTASFTPTALLNAAATYTASLNTTVKGTDGTPLEAAVSWTFTTNACPCMLFPTNPSPGFTHLSTANGRPGGPWSLELGVKIRVSEPTRLSAIRFYKDTLETGTHVGRLWNASGGLVTSVTFASETASGWQRQTLPNPPLLQPNVIYVVSVNANANFTQTYLALQNQIDSGPLHSVADGANGVYGDTGGNFPTQTFNSSSYGIDPEVVPDGEVLPLGVSASKPADTATGISPDTSIRATFTRSIDQSTLIAANFIVTAPDSSVVPGTITYDDTTQTARFTPTSPLALGSVYTVRLTTGIHSSTGSPLSSAVQWSFTTAATMPPALTVSQTLPTGGAADIGAAVHPRAMFSKPIDGASIDNTSFTLAGPSGAVPTTASYDPSTQSATLLPQAPLVPGSTYTATLAATVEATDGSHLNGGFTWSFTVAATAPGPPAVTSTSPAAGASSVGLSPTLSATFSISMDPTSLTGGTFTANRTDGAGTVTGTVTYDPATKTARLVPSSPLAPMADYFARIDGSVKAADGTPLGTAFGWSFSTTACPCAFYFDTDAPNATGISTINGDNNGSVTLELGVKIKVDEPMLLTAFRFFKSPGETGTHTGRLWNSAGMQLAQQDFVGETASGWQTQTLTTPYELQPGIVYTVSANANQFFVQTQGGLSTGIISGPLRTAVDGANAVFGHSAGTFPTQSFNNSSYYVDLRAVVEGTPAAPTVTVTKPLAGATLAPVTTDIRATFSRPIDPRKIDGLSFSVTRADLTNVSGTTTYDDTTNTAIFTPTTALAYGSTYTAKLTTAIKARDGVPLAAPFSWTFATTALSPTVVTATPADAATNVARNAKFQLVWSKDMDLASLQAGLTLTKDLAGSPVAATVTYDSASKTSTLTPTALLDVSGGYTLRADTTVKGVDGSFVTPAYTLHVTTTADGTPPVVTITSAPPAQTKLRTATVAFTSNETGSTFECRIDGGGWRDCTTGSSVTYTALVDGPHTIDVRATDAVGNLGTAATASFTVDTDPPGGNGGSFLTSKPPSLTTSNTATFTYAASEPSTFTCSLDGVPATDCTTGLSKTYTSLADGSHNFVIVATDTAGNSSAPESYTWTVDTTPPVATITSGPFDPTRFTNATFVFGSEPGATVEVSLDNPSPSAFATATSPKTYPGPLAEGGHTFRVRATDPAGNQSAIATYTWVVDTTPPTVSISSGPADPTKQTTASFVYASEANATFECALDAGAFGSCPQSGYSGLADGSHTFQVRATDRAGNTGAAASFTWRVDTIAPTASITTAPADPTKQTTAAFVFGSSETGSSFQCALDGAAFGTCPASYTGLADGSHTFQVKATDQAGNTGNAASYTWRVDTIAPDTAITAGPSNPTNAATAVFTFTATETPATFQCSLDGAAFGACPPASYSGLADGSHTFRVQATDQAGNTDATPASFTWVVDTAAPTVSITSGPADPTKVTSATFAYNASQTGSTFQCSLDGAAFASCPSSYTGLADATHTFQVKATDPAGNTGPAASYTWRVDTIAPTVSITSGPADPTKVTTATFAYSAEAGATFQCSLDGAAFGACLASYTGLSDATHTFQVKATDLAGNTGNAASYTWRVDTIAPDTAIATHPSDPTNSKTAAFTFTASETGSTFQCSLDGAAFGTCPASYSALADGSHTFQVKATDVAGNTDATPASFTWKVDTIAPTASVTSGPADPTKQTSATFAYTSSETGSTFQCSLDGAAFGTCPASYSALADGSHTFQVKATDAASNTGTAASYTWRVDTIAPTASITSGPADPTKQTTATFAFSSEAGATFTCSLDGAAFGTCPASYSTLADGSHTFQVKATDQAGNTGAAASFTWRVDTIAPDTTILTSPVSPTNATTAAFTFSSTETGSTFQCSLDGAAFGSCPASYTGLADGSHTFQVKATDQAGNTDATAASFTWTVDTSAPVVAITSSPNNPTNQTTAAFTYTSKAGSTFQCSLDSLTAYGPCPVSFTGLADGSHTFRVKATDPAGNTGLPTAFIWTVDTVAPTASVTSGPADPTKQTTATFAYTSSETGSTFACSLDGAAFGTCPASYGALADGSHTFQVKATDAASNTGAAASYTWRVDTIAPDTAIATHPSDPTNATTAAFTYTSEANATFQCSLDGAAFAACPASYTGLAAGSHTFQVRASDQAGNTDATPASFTWTVDLTGPVVSITSGPASPTKQTTATFAYGSESGATFTCSLDGAAFGTCPASYSALAEGSHTFQVKATDTAGNTGSAASYTWTVDLTPPTASITSGPASPTKQTTATFAFSSEAGATFTCSLDGAAFGTCPASYSALLDGSHTFQVKATDLAGNTGTAASYTWTVDTVAPTASVTSGPASPTKLTTATFAYTSSESGSSFTCSLDGAAFGTCPASYSALADGSHTFQVKATDAASNTGAAASFTWTVDTVAPTASVTSGPASPTKLTTATFAYTSSESGSSFTCSLDGAAFGTCPASYSALADGSHTFQVKATDAASNTGTAASYTWTVDTIAPTANVTSGPASPTKLTTATFAYTSSESGSTFQCSLDGAAFGTCPASYSTLADGSHTFQVKATDQAGNTGTAASYTWTVDTIAPTANVTSGPTSPTKQTTATFAYTSSESGSSFTCSLDGAAFGTCPASYSALADGSHTFQVKATDAASNTGAAASFTWTVDTIAPTASVTSGPADPTKQTSATFAYTSSETGSTFQCSLDGAAFGTCPASYSTLADGSHTFQVKATDAASNTGTAASYTWRVDTIAPDTTIATTPANPTSATSAAFTYTATETGSSFTCSLDGAAFGTCPASYTGLAAGSHTFQVKATDQAGNTDATAASFTWLIDTSPPSTPTLAFSNFSAAGATGTSVFYKPGAGGGFTVTPSSTDAQTSIGYTFPTLGGGWSGSAGVYSFSGTPTPPAGNQTVTATNAAGLSASSTFTVTPDTTAPTTTILCNGSPCLSTFYSSAVTVTMSGNDGAGSGVAQTKYTLDGLDPTPLYGTVYLSGFSVGSTTTVKFRSYDAVTNEELVGTQTIKVDTTPPSTPTLTPSESGPYGYVNGSQVFYNPGTTGNLHTGSFTVGAATSDGESGITKVAFPTPATLTGGGDDTATPYSTTYSWTGASTASGTQNVTATNGSGLTSSSSFTLTPDNVAPSGGSISYTGGFTQNTSVTIATTDGTDNNGGSGIDPAGKFLERRTATLSNGTCGAYGTWAAVTSPDTVANATCAQYQYRVDDRVGNEVVYSGPAVMVDNGIPGVPALVLAESSQYEDVQGGTTLFYNANTPNTGSFTVTATSSAASGLASIAFPTVGTMTGGGTDTTSPYVGSYSWLSGQSASGTQTVTATSAAGKTSTSTFTVTPDAAAPTGQSIAFVGGPWFTTTSIPISLAAGSDALSGNDTTSAQLQRADATLANGVCGSFSAFAGNFSSPDTTVASGHCYRYQYSIADKVGNRSAWVQSVTAMVDTTPPSAPALTYSGFTYAWANTATSTVYYNGNQAGGFTVTGSSTDGESGIASYAFPSLGASWSSTGGTNSMGYTFGTSSTAPATQNVTATNGAGTVSTGSPFTVVRDPDGPTGGSIGFTDGYRTAASVALTLADGTDALSGVNATTQQLQRADGTLSGGNCSAYSGFATIATSPGASYTDTTVASGHCYQYRYVVTDKVGNPTTYTTPSVAKVDTDAPTATLADPGANLRLTVTLAATSGDTGGSGLDPATSTVFQRSPAGANTWATIPQAWVTTTETDGLYDVRVVVTDRAGNSTAATVTGRRVDNTPPVATLNDPGQYLAGTVAVTGTSSDTGGSGVSTTTFQWAPAGGSTWTTITNPANWDTTTAATPDGLYDLHLVVVDNAGNQTISTVAGRRIDNTKPTATMNDPGTPVRGTVTLTSATADGGSGIKTVTYQRSTDGTTWTDTPAAWDTTAVPDGDYQLRVVAQDNALNSQTSANPVTTHVDNTTPRITSTSPANGAGNVAPTAKVTATFNHPMVASTVIAALTLKVTSGAAVPATVTWDSGTNTATLTPTASLAESTSYTATMDKSATASDNSKAMYQSYSWTFSTGTAPPIVTANTPSNGATGVAVNVNPTATFSRDMDLTTVVGANVTMTGPSGAVAATVGYVQASHVVTITPSASLANNSTYTVNLSGNVKSFQGVALAPFSWSFTTVSGAPPTVTSQSPAPGATGTTVMATPSAGFSTDLLASTVTPANATLTGPSGTVATTVGYDGTTKTVTITPTAQLANNATYTVTMTTGIKSSGNVALASPVSWTFTTTNNPELASSTPAAGATDVALTTKPTIVFTKPMDATTMTAANISMKRWDNTLLPTVPSYDAPSKTLTITPSAPYDYTRATTVTLGVGIKDSTGVALPAAQTWSFTTTGTGSPVRLNAGGSLFTSSIPGVTYAADYGFTGGTARTNAGPISPGTPPDPDPGLSLTDRWGLWNYTLPVPNGVYDIKLHFVDPQYSSGGSRLFHVDVLNTATVNDLQNVDIAALVGRNTPLIKTIPSIATGGSRNIRLKAVAVTDQPEIAAIEIVPRPTVATTWSPGTGATGVATNTTVTATFDRGMDPAAITTSTVTLTGPSGAVAATVAYDSPSKTLTLTPSGALAGNTSYTVRLDPSVRDSWGMTMGVATTWTFRTA